MSTHYSSRRVSTTNSSTSSHLDSLFDSYTSSNQSRKSSLASSIGQALHTDAYSRIRDVPLTVVPSGERIKSAQQLWRNAPVLIYVVRRAGCPLCRSQALLISASSTFLARLGYSTVAVLNDAEDGDMVGFAKKHWNGRIVLDQELAFHLAVGEGEVKKGKATDALSLGFTKRIWRSMAQNRVMGSSKSGNGPYMGGVMLVMPGDEGIVHTQAEQQLGDFGSFEHTLRAAYAHSPLRHQVKTDELDEAIRDHHRRSTRKLPKQCGCADMQEA